MALNIGDKAPDFSLVSSEKTTFKLSENTDKNTVILFFPLAFTGVCTAELCSVRDNYADYGKLDAHVVAISVDSFATLAKFKEEQKFTFPLLSDFNKEVGDLYGVLYTEFVFGMKGVTKRSAFVIDKDGIVRYSEILENAGDLPNFEAIHETLKSLN